MHLNRNVIIVVLCVAFLYACSIPMTTSEYRQAAKSGAALLTTETFEVNRPLSEVAKTFKKKAPECLDFAIGSTERPVIGIGSTTRYYGTAKQTVLVSENKAELHFQVKYANTITKEPQDGSYYLIADAYPSGKGKTRVDIYRRTCAKVLAEAVKG